MAKKTGTTKPCRNKTTKSGKRSNLGKRDGTGPRSGTQACPKTKTNHNKKKIAL